MRVSVLLLVLCFGTQAWTQTSNNRLYSVQPVLTFASLNSAEASTRLMNVSASPEPYFAPAPDPLAMVATASIPWTPKPLGKTVDKKFLMLFGLTAALTVADIELTQHCLQAGTCHETNFLYGSNPTRARMYGINIPILSAQMVFSAWLKHRQPERHAWMLSPIVDSVAHGVGAISGLTK
jgi:hypothetical protein